LSELADDRPDVRDRAQRKVEGLGAGAVPLLQRSLHHADPEVVRRCREVLLTMWTTDPTVRTVCLGLEQPPGEDLQVETTGLGLLCFLGAGYTQLSRDQFRDPDGRVFDYGQVVRKAADGLLSKQTSEGSFGSRAPVAHAIATLAMSEIYGMTVARMYQAPAAKALAFLKTLKSSEPLFLVWKGMALHSAHLSELPDCPETACDEMADLLDQQGSRSTAGAALLLSLCGKRRTGTLLARFSGFSLERLSPLETWLCTTALLRCSDEASKTRWRENVSPWLTGTQECRGGCDAGSWASTGMSWRQNLVTTLYATLTMERVYEYRGFFFSSPWGK
jgi:hypothetical protein